MLTREYCDYLSSKIFDIEDYVRQTKMDRINKWIWRKRYIGSTSLRLYIYGPLSEEGDCNDDVSRRTINFKPDTQCNNYTGSSDLFVNHYFSSHGVHNLIAEIPDGKYNCIYFRGEIPNIMEEYSETESLLCHEHDRFSNLLALNRVLCNYLSHSAHLDVVVTGINYFLSKKKYSKHYERMSEKGGFKRNRKSNLTGNMNHDVIMNFMYTKYLIETKQVKLSQSEEFKAIMFLSLPDYINKYISFRK